MKSQFVQRSVLLAMVLTSCTQVPSSLPPPSSSSSPNPSIQVAESEAKFEDDLRPEIRAQARQATVDYIKAKIPGWQIKGISSQAYQYNEFTVDVDIIKDQLNVVLPFRVQKFFPETDTPYWRATLLHTVAEQALDEILDKAAIKRLNDPSTDSPRGSNEENRK